MNRREFVHEAGCAIATVAGGRALSASRLPSVVPRERIGLELYTVRKELARDLERTLAEVAAIGYSYVEVVWPPAAQNPPELRRILDRVGLRATSGHISASAFDVGWDRRLDAAKTIGHEYLFCASLPRDARQTLDDWREWGDRFNRAASVARKHDMWLGFHTEPDHFTPIAGQIPYDVFVERTDPALVRHQLDVGNVAMAGRDPLEYLTRWRDRYWSFHIKDVPTFGAMGDTELGAGKLDLRRILSSVGSLEQKLLYVEQEGSADSLTSARKDFAYLSTLVL